MEKNGLGESSGGSPPHPPSAVPQLPHRPKYRNSPKDGTPTASNPKTPPIPSKSPWVRINARHWAALENMAGRLEKDANRKIRPVEVLGAVLEYLLLNEMEAEGWR